jgi:Fimbrial assembly protein (PilN).
LYKINLLPPELLPGPYIQGKRLFVIAGINSFFGALLIGGGIFFLQTSQIKAELLSGQAELASLKEKSKSVNGMRTQRFELEKKTAVLEGLLLQRGAYRPVLDGIARCVPVDVWLTGINVQESNVTEIAQVMVIKGGVQVRAVHRGLRLQAFGIALFQRGAPGRI